MASQTRSDKPISSPVIATPTVRSLHSPVLRYETTLTPANIVKSIEIIFIEISGSNFVNETGRFPLLSELL